MQSAETGTMKRPGKRHKFNNIKDELNYLSDIVRYHHAMGDRNRANRCLPRMKELLAVAGADDGSIILQDHWAVFHEASGNLSEAISCREREISLIRCLFQIGGPVPPIDHEFLRDVTGILARDYALAGETEKLKKLNDQLASESV